MPKCIQPFVHFRFALCSWMFVLASPLRGRNAKSLVFFMDKRHYGVSWFRNEFMRFVTQKVFCPQKRVCDIWRPIQIVIFIPVPAFSKPVIFKSYRWDTLLYDFEFSLAPVWICFDFCIDLFLSYPIALPVLSPVSLCFFTLEILTTLSAYLISWLRPFD